MTLFISGVGAGRIRSYELRIRGAGGATIGSYNTLATDSFGVSGSSFISNGAEVYDILGVANEDVVLTITRAKTIPRIVLMRSLILVYF